jgi:hypothetical protein
LAHGPGNVFDALFAQILEDEIEPVAHLVANDLSRAARST